MAAVNIGGRTLHSFAGIGFGKEPVKTLLQRVRRSRRTMMRWQNSKVLIVDEVSMIESGLFDKIEQIARDVRGEHDKPFGGLQVILCGDFLQLPPVSMNMKFAFEARSWRSCVTHEIVLTKVFRQKNQKLVKILNDLRMGSCNAESEKLLRSCLNKKLSIEDGIEPTRLYPNKRSVKRENEERMEMLRTEEHVFMAEDSGNQMHLNNLQKNCPAPAVLRLKEKAQVMLLKNLDFEKGLVNGSRGVVTGYTTQKFQDEDGKTSEEIVPIVRFFSGVECSVGPEEWKISSGEETMASRVQIPLVAAWALTIHKCQGMTIDKATMSLADCFEFGQLYVAVSRIRSLDGLSLTSFDRSKVKAHPKVKEYYRTLKLGARPLAKDTPEEIGWTTKHNATKRKSDSFAPCQDEEYPWEESLATGNNYEDDEEAEALIHSPYSNRNVAKRVDENVAKNANKLDKVLHLQNLSAKDRLLKMREERKKRRLSNSSSSQSRSFITIAERERILQSKARAMALRAAKIRNQN
mmetsp:Transcript_38965/g.62447  ORF Transcript_38965/g.62447 Transcript_38965/m.62447 type:complete len:520 (-) Transcript_38965:118-1677(-)